MRDGGDAPHADLVSAVRAAGRTVELRAWGARQGGPIEVGFRRRSRTEAARVHVPSPGAVIAAARWRGIVVTRELNPLTGAVGLLRRRGTTHSVCLIEADPAFGGASTTARWKLPIRRLIARRVSVFVANTDGARRWLEADLAVGSDRIVSGWWLAGLPSPPQEAGTDGKQGPASLRVTGVGKLIERKGFDVLLAASANLRSAGIDLVVRIAGTGPEGDRLSSIDPRSEFVGHLDREGLIDLLLDSDVVVMPSFEELMGRAGVEALSLGVPVVVSDVAGIGEALVVPSGSGVVVPVGDVAALETVLRSLDQDRARLHELRDAAHHLAPRLSPSACAEVVFEAIRRVEEP